jgi:hypothetical protein
MSMLTRTNELSLGNQMYGTDGYLHQCSLDRDHVCSAMIAEFYGWNGLVWKVSEVRMTNVVLEVFDCWECRM